jgi:hypothetical protein
VTETELVIWLSSKDEAPITQSVTDNKIIDSVLNQTDNSDTESDEESEKVTYDEGMSSVSFFTIYPGCKRYIYIYFFFTFVSF